MDRLVYYTSRIVNNQVKKNKSYELPHIYVLSLLVDDQFPLEPDTYFHQCQVMRNRKYPFKKIDVFLVEMSKFFRMDDRLQEENCWEARDVSPRAEMLRLFRDVLEDKTIDEEKAGNLLDEDFAKDVSFVGYTDELLLLVFFRETLAQLKLRSFIEKDILQLSSGEAAFPC
ncbi:MAG: PD-(D/E)XK nuclease family transposase [Fibrobacter sp.]|nr:PD-(D/E)XK nuclease family transposase [Fibrobacter sp.]